MESKFYFNVKKYLFVMHNSHFIQVLKQYSKLNSRATPQHTLLTVYTFILYPRCNRL